MWGQKCRFSNSIGGWIEFVVVLPRTRIYANFSPLSVANACTQYVVTGPNFAVATLMSFFFSLGVTYYDETMAAIT